MNANTTNYDNLHNEGGEGYNPHREPASVGTEYSREQKLRRELEILESSTARECGMYDADKVAGLRAELEAIEQARTSDRWQEWTLETTKARRAEWNTEAQRRRPRSGREVAKMQSDLGYTITDLKAAVAHYGL